jgi:hypothetical protein
MVTRQCDVRLMYNIREVLVGEAFDVFSTSAILFNDNLVEFVTRLSVGCRTHKRIIYASENSVAL